MSGLPPSTILAGRYRIERVLGRGGMGAVYEATRVDLDRRVAIKLLDRAVDAPEEALAATEREARAAAKLAHPHIVQVIDFSRGEGGPPFFVMELLDGESLDARLHRVGRIPSGTAALIMVQVLSALAAAHASGIIHRDVKPANVFLTPTAAGFDFVKLLDFGVAGNLSPVASVRGAALTGTPSHMAPEQIRGERLDARTDVWAAGVCLHEMLSGTLPFDGENIAALLTNICSFAPLPLLDVDPPLAAIVMRAMAKDPAARFASSEAMRAALAPYAAVGAVPSQDLLAGKTRALEGAITIPDVARMPETVTTAGVPLAATLRDPAQSGEAAVSATVASGAPMQTLASGSARTFPDLRAPERDPGWPFAINVGVAVGFLAFVTALLVPRAKELPREPAALVCSFAPARTWGSNIVDLRLAATSQGALLAASTTRPALVYATLADLDAPFDDWPDTLFATQLGPNEKIMPLASAGDQLWAGGIRTHPIGTRTTATYARFGRPSGPMNLGNGGRLQNIAGDVRTAASTSAGAMTVVVSAGDDGPEHAGLGSVRLFVSDGPRSEVTSFHFEDVTQLAVDTTTRTIAVLLVHDEHASVRMFDARTLQDQATNITDESTHVVTGAITMFDEGFDAVWVQRQPPALGWSRQDKDTRPLGGGLLVEGDVFSPSITHDESGVVLAWGEHGAEGTRIHLGRGKTPREAVERSSVIEAGRDARNIVVAASDRPWLAWVSGKDASANVTRLACRP